MPTRCAFVGLPTDAGRSRVISGRRRSRADGSTVSESSYETISSIGYCVTSVTWGYFENLDCWRGDVVSPRGTFTGTGGRYSIAPRSPSSEPITKLSCENEYSRESRSARSITGPYATSLVARTSPAPQELASRNRTLIHVLTDASAGLAPWSAPGPHSDGPGRGILADQ
jgi:hypothetical protein